MSQIQAGRPGMPMTASESLVLNALSRLPDAYQVMVSPPRFSIAESWGENRSITYEPDFEIVDQNGRRLVVEVKSASALSLPNMVRFVEIAKAIEASDAAFLVLVWGGERSKSRVKNQPEFSNLHIRYANSPSEVVRAIENEFAQLL